MTSEYNGEVTFFAVLNDRKGIQIHSTDMEKSAILCINTSTYNSGTRGWLIQNSWPLKNLLLLWNLFIMPGFQTGWTFGVSTQQHYKLDFFKRYPIVSWKSILFAIGKSNIDHLRTLSDDKSQKEGKFTLNVDILRKDI